MFSTGNIRRDCSKYLGGFLLEKYRIHLNAEFEFNRKNFKLQN